MSDRKLDEKALERAIMAYERGAEWNGVDLGVREAIEIYLKLTEAAKPAGVSAPSAEGWNFDMEAAPKDGTRILAWAKKYEQVLLRDHPGPIFVVYYDGMWRARQNIYVEPTAWRPLPAAPRG